jgi:hypothetical protein
VHRFTNKAKQNLEENYCYLDWNTKSVSKGDDDDIDVSPRESDILT